MRQHTERQLRIERGVPVMDTVRADGFRLSSAVKFVPRFQDNQMDVYLVAFEKCMLVHHFIEGFLDSAHPHPTQWKSFESFR